jgi:raffinose/stachyose/melibiose transport system permease protein
VSTAVQTQSTTQVIARPTARRLRLGRWILRGFTHLFLIVAVMFALLPVVLMVQASFKSLKDFYTNALGFPSVWKWQNYTDVWRDAHIPEYARNSIIITGVSVPAILFLACLAGYGLTRYQYAAAKWLFIYFLCGLLIPVQLTILPIAFQLKTLKLENSHAGLITISVALGLPFSVFLMAGFMRTLPRELAEAAHLDGAGEFRAFWDVILPLTKPALATVAILTGVGIWNEFQVPLILTPDVPTLQVGVNNLRGFYSTNWGAIFAGVTLAALPVLVAYWLLTKQFIRGLSAGAVKG